jgi:hypothetical protein
MRGSINAGARTDHWFNGDTVTNRHTDAIGAVKWTNSRQSDGKRFVRVRILEGQAAGCEVWENDNWILGRGKAQITCLECGYPFRTDDLKADFCPCCDRHHRPVQTSTGPRPLRDRAGWTWDPAREPTAEERAAAAEQRRRDQEETPF